MAANFGIIGCGYVGSAAALQFRSSGCVVTGTTTTPQRLAELCDLVDHPRLYRAGDPGSDSSFLEPLDGLLIAMAPTTATYEEDQYQAVYGKAIPALVEALKHRSSHRPLHVSYLSSAGIYGNQSGELCTELTPPDLSNGTNALLADAESAVLSLNNDSATRPVCCVLVVFTARAKIFPLILSASGQCVPKNGNHINAWVHLQDIIRGIDFSYRRRLQGIYNLVDDMQFTRRQLSNTLCDEEGLPPVIWENHDRAGARIFNARVSNARLRQLGFRPSISSMLEPVAAA